jgi:hypothetical protein
LPICQFVSHNGSLCSCQSVILSVASNGSCHLRHDCSTALLCVESPVGVANDKIKVLCLMLFYLTVTICINLTHSCLYSSMSKFCDLQDWKSPVEYCQW